MDERGVQVRPLGHGNKAKDSRRGNEMKPRTRRRGTRRRAHTTTTTTTTTNNCTCQFALGLGRGLAACLLAFTTSTIMVISPGTHTACWRPKRILNSAEISMIGFSSAWAQSGSSVVHEIQFRIHNATAKWRKFSPKATSWLEYSMGKK